MAKYGPQKKMPKKKEPQTVPKKPSEMNFFSSLMLLTFSLVLVFTLLFIYSPQPQENVVTQTTPTVKQNVKTKAKPSQQVTPEDRSLASTSSASKPINDFAQPPQANTTTLPASDEDAVNEKLQDDLAKAMKLVDHGQVKDAQALLESILQAHPTNEFALTELGMLHLLDYKDTGTALTYLEKVMKLNPGNKVVMNELVAIYEDTGRGEGLKFLQSLYDENPDNTQLAQGIGQILLNQNRPQEAMPYFEKGTEDGKDPQAYKLLADSLADSGQADKAIDAYRKVVELERENLAIGKYSEQDGKDRVAMAQLNVIYKLMEDNKNTAAEAELMKIKSDLPEETVKSIMQRMQK